MMAAAAALEGAHSPSKELTVSPSSSAAQTRRGASSAVGTNSTPLHDSAALRSATIIATAQSTPSKELGASSHAAQTRRGAASAGTNSSSTLLHDSSARSSSSTAPNTPNATHMAAPQHSPISTPTGTKLAVSTPSESHAGGEGVGITLDEEKKIALSQLQELEVAIKVRKVTKVDGRKIRWIEYRERKRAEEEKQLALSSSIKKKTRRSKSRSKGENSENDANVVNNNNNNNNSKSDSTMKVEMTSSPLSVVGTSNVLESMKQQFLQGTDAISNGKSSILTEAAVSTQRRKSGRTRKSMSTPEIGSPNNVSPEKAESVPAENSDADTTHSLPSTPVTSLTTDQPLGITLKKSFFSPRSLTKGLREVRKSENGSDGTSPPKTENGDNSTATSPTTSSMSLTTVVSEDNELKPLVDLVAETPAAESDATAASTTGEKKSLESKETKPLTDGKVYSEVKTETKPSFSLVKAAARLLSPPTARSKSADNSGKVKKVASQKGSTKKNATKASGRSLSEPRKAVNGFSEIMHNGSPVTSEAAEGPSLSETVGTPVSGPIDGDAVSKRPRGRPPKRKAVVRKETNPLPGKSGKKVATVVVDVHNTMNGEPQTVIPVSRPVLRGKRMSPAKKLSQTPVSSPCVPGAIDPEDSKDASPAAKRQKVKEVVKVKVEEEFVSVANDAVTDTKRGKSSTKKKKKDEPVREDRKMTNENTSASTLNQTQVSPEKSQSTKLAKGVEKPTQKEVASVFVSSNSNNSTASPNLTSKKKVKSSPKPKTSKAKTKPGGQVKVSKLLKASMQKATSTASKGKAVAKGSQKQATQKSSQKELQVEEEVNESKVTPKQAPQKSSLKEAQVTETDEFKGSQKQATHKSKDPLVEEDCESKASKQQSPPKSIPKDPLALDEESSEPSLAKDMAEQVESTQSDSAKVDILLESGLLPADTTLKSENVDMPESNESLSQKLSPEKKFSQEIDAGVARSVLEDNSVGEDCKISVACELETTEIISKEEEFISMPHQNSLSEVSDKVDLSFNNNILPEADAMLPSETESHSQNNNDPLLKDKVLIYDDTLDNKTFESDSPSLEKDTRVSLVEECKAQKDNQSISEKVSPQKESLQVEKVAQEVSQVEIVASTKEAVSPEVQTVSSIKDSPSSVADLAEKLSDTEDESVKDSSFGNKSLVEREDGLPQVASPGMKDQSDFEGKLTVYDFPSPERVSPNKDNPVLSISRHQDTGAPKETYVPVVVNKVSSNESLNASEQSKNNSASSLSTKMSKVAEICRSDSNLTHWSTADVEITVVKNSTAQTPTKVLKSPKKEYVSPVSITTSEPQQCDRREASIIKKMVKKDQTSALLLEREIVKPTVAKSQVVSHGKESSDHRGTSKTVDAVEMSCTTAPLSEGSVVVAAKSKEKVPRILKQLFQDEGVQNMLKSMSEESGTAPETSPNSDSGVHKLRPKRATEPMLSSSPELDAMEVLLSSVTKKKKRGTEVDTLYMDEGVLNLLTSIDPHSRRGGHHDDASSDVSQTSSSRNVKANKPLRMSDASSDNRKRKLSGANTISSSAKLVQPPEAKRMRQEGQEGHQDPYELASAEEFREQVASGENSAPLEHDINLTKKKGKPILPLSVKQKNKAIRMQLKLQKQKQIKVVANENKLGKEDDNMNLAQLQDVLRKAKEAYCEMPLQVSNVENENSKSVPPLKIRLASDSVTIKPIARPHPVPQLAEVTVLSKPASKPVQGVVKPAVNDITSQLQARPSSTPPDVRVATVRPGIDKPRVINTEQHTSPPLLPPPPPPQQRRPDSFTTTTHTGFPSLVRGLDLGGQAKSRQRLGGESLRQSQRASVRQSEGSYHYRDISLRKFSNFTQIILSPSTTKMKNALNSRVLRELCEALTLLRRDESVKMVLLTGTGSTFCQGVDLTALQHPNIDTRKKNAENLVRGIKEFLKVLVQFPKPLIAGVNGNAMGLGVTMLPLFDTVIVNDKAEFYLPYATLGQVPEGGATYTFPNMFGKLKSTKLFQGYKLTAAMATELGLASETLWPATFQEQLIPKVALLATQSSQSMEATKALMNHHLVTKLELSLESECRVLLQHWTSPHFAHLCKKFLESNHIQLQKPVNLPL